MVKKQLKNGAPCDKCAQTEEMLRTRGLWQNVDEVVWAIEGEDDSPGALLARLHGVEAAPFFVLRDDAGVETVYTSPLKLIRDHFPSAPRALRLAPLDPTELPALAERFSQSDPAEILRWGLERYGQRCGIAFSGAEDVVVIDMAARLDLPFRVFYLDTGRMHEESYSFLDAVQRHYGIVIDTYFPEAAQLENLVRRKGPNSFYQDGHEECCGIRKVEPLKRALVHFEAWVSGQRCDQSPATRSGLPVILEDTAFEGARGCLVKLNPLANWNSTRIWSYIRKHRVPHNELHDRGFVSIDCQPCTRPIRADHHEREGRWWWENDNEKEGVLGDGI
jgi:phosphoadenosine phosphosulfate reductase